MLLVIFLFNDWMIKSPLNFTTIIELEVPFIPLILFSNWIIDKLLIKYFFLFSIHFIIRLIST